MNKFTLITIFICIFFLLDFYAFQGVKLVFSVFPPSFQNFVFSFYWTFNSACLLAFLYYHLGNPDKIHKQLKVFMLSALFISYTSKLLLIVFLLIDDLQRFLRWSYLQIKILFFAESVSSEAIPRSQILARLGMFFAAVPFFSLAWGIISGAHDYRIRKVKISLKDLPPSLEGLRILQLSDVHAGSLWSKKAVSRGLDMAMSLKADIIFFTGDLVNNKAEEMQAWMEIFSRLKAPLGVYSILGNHDYGDYVDWPSAQAKRQNLQQIMDIHQQLGWQLLMDEHKILKVRGVEIAIIGVQNWGAKARFKKYGNLQKAYEGSEKAAVKILLSHDPSHWKAQVIPNKPDIDITFSGHTHGMQFGIELPGFKWSPVQYIYDEWAGLYSSKGQYLYVNRGFGYLGYPGRVGIPPEITLIKL